MNHLAALHELLRPRQQPVAHATSSSSTPDRGGLPLMKALVPRSSSICTGQDCPTGSGPNTGVIIGVSAAIPIVACLIALVFLHRRHVRKQRLEDANDKHRSLDFGLDSPRGKKGKDDVPGMTITDTEKRIRLQRGMSMDMGSPFIMPAAVQASRDSIHSLARSMHDSDDPYRPVTLIKDDSTSLYSHGRGKPSNLSIYSTSTGAPSDASYSNLLKNAQRISAATPLTKSTTTSSSDLPQVQLPEPAHGIARKETAAIADRVMAAPVVREVVAQPSIEHRGPADQKPSRNPAVPISGQQHPTNPAVPLPVTHTSGEVPNTQSPRAFPLVNMHEADTTNRVRSQPQVVRPRRLQSMEASIRNASSTSTASGSESAAAVKESQSANPSGRPSPSGSPSNRSAEAVMPAIAEHEQPAGLGVHGLGFDLRRLSTGTRPLPPDELNDNPEQRANRIRSFYKEYFDESKPDAAAAAAAQRQHTAYYEDYGQEYLNNGAVLDPATGRFVVAQAPYAQPVTRRAMTPPPRAPPRFKGATPGRGSMGSNNHHGLPGPRRFSSASNTPNTGPRGRPAGPRKPVPMPSPLQTLPTPHLLKEDSMVFSPIDFAPPASYRERQAGRSSSPLGEKKLYSPTVRAHTPLASTSVDLAHIPSPHALRKSGSFTALDFAPVPRFRTSEVGSDAGSVRSHRSGMSEAHVMGIKSGAYRVSRIPKEWVGTKDDLAVSLRPTWDQRG